MVSSKLLRVYRILSFAGMGLFIAAIIIELLQKLNPDRMHFDFGVWMNLGILILFIMQFFFFILSLKAAIQIEYGYFLNKPFYVILMIGILILIIPCFLFSEWLKNYLYPPQPSFFDEFALIYLKSAFSSSPYTHLLNDLSSYVMAAMALVILLLLSLMICFKRKLKSAPSNQSINQ